YGEAVRLAPAEDRYKITLNDFEKRTSDAELLSKGVAGLGPPAVLSQATTLQPALIRDQKVILRFSLEKFRHLRSLAVRYLAGDVTAAEDGSALIDGSAAWKGSVLPRVAEATIVGIKKDPGGVLEVQLAVLRAR